MRHSFGQFLLTMLLAAVILAVGWLGICNLGLILPSGTDGYQLHNMAALNEESFISNLSAPSLSPFTDDGFPEGAVLLDAESTEYKQYYDMIASLTDEDKVLNLLINVASESLPDIVPTDEQKESYREDLAVYADERGTWLMAQISQPTEEGFYQLQFGIHSKDGFRIFRIQQDGASHVRLTPDANLLQRAADTCSEFMSYWKSCAQALQDKNLETYAMVLDSTGELFEYAMTIPMPQDIFTPLRTEIDGTRCHVYYPAEGGEIVMIYDFIGMHVVGAAFIPQA